MNVTLLLGDEYDDFLFETLINILKSMRAKYESRLDAIIGSQDISKFIVNLNDEEIIIERETYIGLTITGNKKIINNIVSLIEMTLKK
ncbi:hypothetical protein O8C85_00555 [Aliarcobacter butzleri]|uniref:hypothetical protein n=1 Tax=Aliarcobacter butzleri TaxID=28197 RepID=UPI00263E4839|nr:hypothetical protein [Aliarcobacter butzleri]MDN5097021.1 hypothetical protein [Aliarcobacter butzleri]